MVSPAAASEQQNATSADIPAGWINRFCGLEAPIIAISSAWLRPDLRAIIAALSRSISVSTQPGLTETQVTP